MITIKFLNGTSNKALIGIKMSVNLIIIPGFFKTRRDLDKMRIRWFQILQMGNFPNFSGKKMIQRKSSQYLLRLCKH